MAGKKEFTFTESETKNFEKQICEEMEAPIKHYERELASLRTGRASTTLVENIKAECYGQMTPLKELATLAAPEARLVTIQPWDTSIIGAIEKAIQQSDLGITPMNDGKIIRLQLPMMTEARRDELSKILSKRTEEARIGVRNIRKDYHNQIRQAEREHGISEDFAARLTDLLQKITDSFIKAIDDRHAKKEHEIRLV